MVEQRDTRKWMIYGGLILTLAIALSVSLRDRSQQASAQRSTTVISEFITLSAAPDPRGIDFLSRERVQRANRLARLDHVQPQVIAGFAALLGLSDVALRLQIADPALSGPFDHTGVRFDSPRDFAQGASPPWDWAVVSESDDPPTTDGAPAPCGRTRPCRAWLLYWDAQTWYYAPVGTSEQRAALAQAVPELDRVLRDVEGF